MGNICAGRVAIVTGAGRGIGREHALMLAENGANRLWELIHSEDFVNSLGAMTGNQAMQQVRAGLTVKKVAPELAHKRVVAGAAVKRIVARPAAQSVIAAKRFENIVSGTERDIIVAVRSLQQRRLGRLFATVVTAAVISTKTDDARQKRQTQKQ